jgi:hypothetical protein
MQINVLAYEQTKATSDTADKVIKLLNYCNTHPETKIRYHTSDMILYIHSDSSYLLERDTKSRVGGSSAWVTALTQSANLPTGKF